MLDLETIKLAQKINLCTYFVLPVLGLNLAGFGGKENFLNSYLSKDLKWIYVEVLDFDLVPCISVELEPEMLNYEGKQVVKLLIPSRWNSHLQLFKEGKYSKFSNKAKRLIREGSTLMYQHYQGAVAITDFRLLALSGSENLRNLWSSLIYDDKDAAHRNAIEEELLSIPDSETFI